VFELADKYEQPALNDDCLRTDSEAASEAVCASLRSAAAIAVQRRKCCTLKGYIVCSNVTLRSAQSSGASQQAGECSSGVDPGYIDIHPTARNGKMPSIDRSAATDYGYIITSVNSLKGTIEIG